MYASYIGCTVCVCDGIKKGKGWCNDVCHAQYLTIEGVCGIRP